MNTLNRSRIDMLIRVRNFGATHRQLFPENSTAHAAFSIVATEVAQIEALAVAERVASQFVRATRRPDAHKQLLDSLTRAAGTARVLSRTIPGLAAPVEVLPRLGDRRLLTISRAFTTAVTPHVAQFAAHGIDIEGLKGLIEALETAANDYGTRRDELGQARARLDASLKRALQAVATLDVIVTNTLANDPVTLSSWKRERRLRLRRARAGAVEKPAVKPAAEAPAAPSEPAAPAVSGESSVPETADVAEDAASKAA